GHALHSFAHSGNFYRRTLLGAVAFPVRAARFSFRIPAALTRRLADNQLLRLSGSERYCPILPRLLRSRLSLSTAGFVWRIGDPVMAANQRRKDSSSSNGFHRPSRSPANA